MRRLQFQLAMTAAAASGLAMFGPGLNTALGAFAVFSTRADSNVRTLAGNSSAQLQQGTLITGQTLSSAIQTDGEVLFSTNLTGTYLVDPAASGGPALSTYSSSTLGLAAAGPTGIAVGNLMDPSTSAASFYTLAPGGATYISYLVPTAMAVSNGHALMSTSAARYTYDINTDTLTNPGGGVSVITGAGDSGQFAADLFGQTSIVGTDFSPISTLSGNPLVAAFASKDILFLDIRKPDNSQYVVTWDTRSSDAEFMSSGSLFLVPVGGTNAVYYSLNGGGTLYDNLDTGDQITFSGQQLVSGFSFGDYAVLGLRNDDGSAGRTIVVDADGNVIQTLIQSAGNDNAAWVTGAGVNTAVPEPASLTMLAIGGWALLRRRKSRA